MEKVLYFNESDRTFLKFGAQLARGAFCRVYKMNRAPTASREGGDAEMQSDENAPNLVAKTFPIWRQFARTIRVISAANDVRHDAREFLEEVRGYSSFITLDPDTSMPRVTLYTIMPQYEIRLSDHIKARIAETGSALPAACVLQIARRLFTSLDILESAQTIHCDIKPSNIMLRSVPIYDANGITSLDTVLCDFGSARATCDRTSDHGPASIGTIPYVAPEILFGQRFSYSADIWSAMLVIFYAITGNDLIDVYDQWGLNYGADLGAIFIQESDDHHDDDEEESDDHESEDHDSEEESDDHDSGESSNDDDPDAAMHDIDFETMYAHIVLFYRLIGSPPESFCDLAPECYYNGSPRYHPNISDGSISQFMYDNYSSLNVEQMRAIERFLNLGLKYMASDRANARAILANVFLR